ncbi:MAG: T9SS type A sorting domain-containing protein [Bacteroidales bacterium]|nr:T9SS type A sorting domain-containing protein [Bacteroidales bacterium]
MRKKSSLLVVLSLFAGMNTLAFSGEKDLELVHFFMFQSLPNDTPIETIDAIYSTTNTTAQIEFLSALDGYPFDSSHPNWRKASMERRGAATEINYRPEGNNNTPYGEAGNIRAMQVKQPFVADFENTLVFHLSTVAYEDVVFTFAAMDEDSGAQNLLVDYSVVSGEPQWITDGLGAEQTVLALINDTYQLYTVNFSGIENTYNNPDFKIRIRFDFEDDDDLVDEGERVTFNNIALDGLPFTGATTFYFSGTGALNDTDHWGRNADGSGENPQDFTSDNQIFVIANTASVTLSDAWAVTGLGSRVVVGDGADATTLIVDAVLDATVDVAGQGTLRLQNSHIPAWSSGEPGSSVIFAVDAVNIPYGTYHHLELIDVNPVFTGNGTVALTGNLTLTGAVQFPDARDAAEYNLVFSGDAEQLITGNGNTVRSYETTMTKTAGSVSLVAGNGGTTLSTDNQLIMNFSSTALFSDNGNDIYAGNSVNFAGDTNSYNLTGTLILAGTIEDVVLGAGAGNNFNIRESTTLNNQPVAALNNVHIQVANTGGEFRFRGGPVMKGDLKVLTGADGQLRFYDEEVRIGGDFIIQEGFSGSIREDGHTIIFNGGGTQNLDFAASYKLNNLEIEEGSSLVLATGTRLTLNGTLSNNNAGAELTLAEDDASNYSDNDYPNEGNLGSGFGAWYSNSDDGGWFLGTATNNGASNSSILNTDEKAFGMWGGIDGDGFSDIGRNFTALENGEKLSFALSFQWDNGNKGINLYTGGVNIEEVFNFNISSGGYTWSGGGSSPITGWDGNGDRQNGVVIGFEFTQTATGLDYRIEMLAGDADEAESNYFGVKTGSIAFAGSINALKLYVSGAGGDGGNLYFNNLQINSTAASGSSGLVIKSGGSLIHNSNDVPATMEREISFGGWHMIAAPVSGMTILGSDFAPDEATLPTNFDFYAWVEGAALPWQNLRSGDNTPNAAFDENFVPGKGYLVAYFEGSFAENPFAFKGTLNNGNVDIPLSFTAGAFEGINFIGNPYPSGINWTDINKDALENVFAYIYNPDTQEYINLEEGTIAPNQGFFVKADEAGTFTLANTDRVHGGEFVKNNEMQETLVLSLENQERHTQTTIRILEGSDFESDRRDALKFFSLSAEMPQLYSYTADNVMVAVNSIPHIDKEQPITLGVRIPADGEYTIGIGEITGSFLDGELFLEDLSEGTFHDLRAQGTYDFSEVQGDHLQRFRIHFTQADQPTDIGEITEELLRAWVYNNILHIHTPEKAEALLLDINGRQLERFRVYEGQHSRALNMPAGVYLLRITTQHGTQTQRVVIH